jgi:eukaryotic-like serine/threonine-protein kinase
VSAAPGDARVQRAVDAATAPLTLTDPVGADVYFRDDTDVDAAWLLVGRVPITGARVPQGELRWRLVKEGFDTAEGASPFTPVITVRRTGEAPAGMVNVRGTTGDQTGAVQLPDFWMDQYEVTNRDFKRFVDAGENRRRS